MIKILSTWLLNDPFSNFQNYHFIDFWLGSWRLRGRKNVSVGHETSIPSIEKLSASSFSSRGLFFSSVWQLSDLGKEKSSLRKESWALTFSSRGYNYFRPYRTFIPEPNGIVVIYFPLSPWISIIEVLNKDRIEISPFSWLDISLFLRVCKLQLQLLKQF